MRDIVITDNSSESNALSKVEGHFCYYLFVDTWVFWKNPVNNNQNYYTYILKCADGSYYIGVTDNPAQRVVTHNAGRGPRWTALRLPVELLYCEMYKTRKEAMQRERQVKKWSRAKKDALIAGDVNTLKKLSRHKIK